MSYPDIKSFILEREFSKFYESGIKSRLNARRLEHSLHYFSEEFILIIMSNKYRMIVSLTTNLLLNIVVINKSTNETLEDLKYSLRNTEHFFHTYKEPLNQYFPLYRQGKNSL